MGAPDGMAENIETSYVEPVERPTIGVMGLHFLNKDLLQTQIELRLESKDTDEMISVLQKKEETKMKRISDLYKS